MNDIKATRIGFLAILRTRTTDNSMIDADKAAARIAERSAQREAGTLPPIPHTTNEGPQKEEE